LIIGKKDSDEKFSFIRIENTLHDLLQDWDAQLLLELKLDTNNTSTDVCTVNEYNCYINIGFPKKGYQKVHGPDSLIIQLNDRFCRLKDIVPYSLSQFEQIPENKEMSFVINCDISTPKHMIDSIVSILNGFRPTKPLKNIYKSCVNIEKEYIGLVKL